MGAFALFRPQGVTQQFGIPSLGTAGRNEVRAVYGGFGLAMGAMAATANLWSSARLGIGLTLGSALLGMALGRAVAVVVERRLDRVPLLYGCVELAGGGAVLWATF